MRIKNIFSANLPPNRLFSRPRKGCVVVNAVNALLMAALFLSSDCAVCHGKTVEIDNPYAGVSWEPDCRQKASLHVHTRVSDGRLFPHEAIDAYKALGYDILAITDHNRVTYPWTNLSDKYGEGYEDRDPAEVGMTDVQGNELSSHHHMTSYWTNHNGTRTEVESLDATAAKGGQTVLCHPGRYNKDVSWYVDLFSRYEHLLGMEVYNQGDRYPHDRQKWDAVLTETMPDRPVWGFSNDDMHRRDHLGRNWNVLLSKNSREAQIQRALARGQFYFVYCSKGHDGTPPPRIESIDINERAAKITIRASKTESIEWISDGEVVGHGEVLELSETQNLGAYVRAMLYGAADDTVAGTQPFGLHWPTPRAGPEPKEDAQKPFTVVLLPDTQFYSQKFPETYLAQTQWIKETAVEMNTKFVVHVGDIVETPGSETEWQVADRAHKVLDGHVPYSVLPGNHDGAPGKLDLYNNYFGPARFAERTWYGGAITPTNNAVNYCRFKAGGRQWMILSLTYDPTEEELSWARKVAAAHPDDEIILVTHAYLIRGNRKGPRGRLIWDKLVRMTPNIRIVVGGHIPRVAHGISVKDNGGEVLEILCDYQGLPNGGNGWLQTMHFDPESGKIRVQAYSPLLDKRNHDPAHSYTVDMPW